MTPKAAQGGRATGTSFKGVFAYLQHDKREEGEAQSDSSDRVAWQVFRNMASDEPDIAWRIMRATANQQDTLKREAGHSVAGNKSDKVVFHYSLGWHPDESAGLTKEEMIKAADESLKALGASDHQAAIIAHDDTPHPHVHVVINRVHPEHGKMLDLWNYKKNLSKWALGYEQERGHIWCTKREQNWQRRDLGDVFSAENDRPYHLQDQGRALGHANDNDLRNAARELNSRSTALSEESAAMHARHAAEWKAYSAEYRAGRAEALGRVKGQPSPLREASERVYDRYKPQRSQLSRIHYRETKAFEKNEERLLGKLQNALQAVMSDRSLPFYEKQNVQTNYFNYLISSKARREALERSHKRDWRKLNSETKAKQAEARERVNETIEDRKALHRDLFDGRHASLKKKHATERKAMRSKWRELSADRAALRDVIQTVQTTHNDEQRALAQSSGLSQGSLLDRFRKPEKKERVNGRKRKGRSRSRKKDTD